MYVPVSMHSLSLLFFFTDTATTEIYTLSLHDALPICHDLSADGARDTPVAGERRSRVGRGGAHAGCGCRSEEHTSELQSRRDLVCRLLLEKKKCKSSIQCAGRELLCLQGVLHTVLQCH